MPSPASTDLTSPWADESSVGTCRPRPEHSDVSEGTDTPPSGPETKFALNVFELNIFYVATIPGRSYIFFLFRFHFYWSRNTVNTVAIRIYSGGSNSKRVQNSDGP